MDLKTNARTHIAVGCLLLTACRVGHTATAEATGASAAAPEFGNTTAKTWIVTPGTKANSVSVGVGDELETRIPTIPRGGFV